MRTRAGDELPQAGGMPVRIGIGVVAAFDERQQYNFAGEITLPDFFVYISQVGFTPLQDGFHLTGFPAVEAYLSGNRFAWLCGKEKSLSHLLPEFTTV